MNSRGELENEQSLGGGKPLGRSHKRNFLREEEGEGQGRGDGEKKRGRAAAQYGSRSGLTACKRLKM